MLEGCSLVSLCQGDGWGGFVLDPGLKDSCDVSRNCWVCVHFCHPAPGLAQTGVPGSSPPADVSGVFLIRATAWASAVSPVFAEFHHFACGAVAGGKFGIPSLQTFRLFLVGLLDGSSIVELQQFMSYVQQIHLVPQMTET